MDIVKKNLFSIILAVLAVAAVVANFYPMGGKYEQLHTQAQARAAMDTSLKSLLNKQRNLPVTNPQGGEAQPLGHFPTPKIIEEGKAATEKISKGSQDLLDGVVKLNLHQPLVEDFVAAVRDRRPPAVTGEMGLAVTRALDAIYGR